jgi:RNA polymerase sigma-70 factor, ECF subfamily
VHEDRRARFDAEAVVHLRAVYNAALRLTRDPERARDLTQDAMLRAFRAFDTFRAGTNARAWLLKVVYSVFVNQYHHDRRSPSTESIEALEARDGFEPAAAPVPLIDPWQADGWTEPVVREALDRLPDEFRTAVLLVDVEELTYEEAASVMGCAVGTIRSRLFRARRLLATALAGLAPQPGRFPSKAGMP